MSQPKPTPNDYVAWMRYIFTHERPTRIVVCDSDAPGAFKVYREPLRPVSFEDWWHNSGSGIVPVPGEDMETHAQRVALEAFNAANNERQERLIA